MTDQISYKFLDKKNLLVSTDKLTHRSFLKFLNGMWSDEHNGWIVPKGKEKDLKNFISTQKLDTISSEIKSRKSQKKYHREVSESEDDDDDYSSDDVKSISSVPSEKVNKNIKGDSSNISKIEKDVIEKRKLEEKTKFEEDKSSFSKKNSETDKKLKKKYMSEDPMLYYKSFNAQPKNFKQINNYDSDTSLSVSSSSCSSSESGDSFPSPKTPKKRRHYNKGVANENYDDILSEVKSLSRKIIELELENKKLKSKNK